MMADLYDRLYPGGDVENVPVHAFHAAIVDYAAGETTRTQIVAVWGLDAEAEGDLDTLCDAVDALGSGDAKVRFAVELHAVMVLAEGAFAARLGLV
jgi:hypothetical protein